MATDQDVSSEALLSHPASEVEPLGGFQLDAYARQLATELTIDEESHDQSKDFLSRIDRHVERIEQAYGESATWASEDSLVSPSAEWLLDNYYVIQDQIRDIREHLPAPFFRELPKLSDGRARVYVIAHELVGHCDSALDEELIVRFVDQFQLNAELTIGETWAFPIMLRLVLLEGLAAICSQIVEEYQSTRDAERLMAGWKIEQRFGISEHSSLRCAPTLIALYHRLGEAEAEYPRARGALDRHLQDLGWNLAELRRLEQHRLARNQVSMGNIITSMRLLTALDWVSFFESTNRTERILQKDPADVYRRMDFQSRNTYRTEIERLARRSSLSETEIAERAVQLASKIPNSEKWREVKIHVGYWLVDDGLATLESEIRYRRSFAEKWRRSILKRPQLVYFGSLFIATTLLGVCLSWGLIAAGIAVQFAVLFALIALIPLSEMAVQLVHTIVTRFTKVRLLPKIEFLNGVDEVFPTFVVVPSMLTSVGEAHKMLERLENHFLANSDPTFRFALLTDYADAKEQHLSTDQEILQVAIEGIAELNRKYSTQASVGDVSQHRSPFYLFHRERRWNDAEQKWMGWERKRGKLMEFGSLLSGHDDTSYIVQEGDLNALPYFQSSANRPFIITLDADTVLPRGAASRMVGTLAHPLNRAIVSDSSHPHVERGYSIVQPRVSMHFDDALPTRYLQIHANSPGIDPYAFAASDVYQDLFGEGSFTGKGIYDLRAFEKTLGNLFPENHILSHDLIEGTHARVALASDLEVFDSYPNRYDVDAKRMHRWVRGDWQIAPWLLPKVPVADGHRTNRLSLLSKWKIFDNLRRSLVAPTLLLFLILGWMLLPELAWVWTLIGFGLTFFPVLQQAVVGLLSFTKKQSLAKQFQLWRTNVGRSIERCGYAAMLLPHQAVQMVDAIVRTLFRLSLSRRRLLEWETAAATHSRLSRRRGAIVRRVAVTSLLAMALLILLPVSALWGASAWLLLWFIAPVVAQVISMPLRRRQKQFLPEDADWVRLIASGTWAYFERYVNESGNWLPPDNVQEYPKEKVATRISPTNEGLFLVGGLVAERMGMIGLQALAELWEKNISSWDALEQMRGHHYNWYETSELRALHPYYISTVDSGNLLACYLTMGRGIQELGKQPLVSERHLIGVRTSLRWLVQQSKASREKLDPDGRNFGTISRQLDALEEMLLRESASISAELSTFTGIQKFVTKFAPLAVHLRDLSHEYVNVSQGKVDSALPAQIEIVAQRLEALHADVQTLLPWLKVAADLEVSDRNALPKELAPQMSLRELAAASSLMQPADSSVHPELTTLEKLISKSSVAAEELWQRYQNIARGRQAAATQMNFTFLYNKRRKLFSIGFNVDAGKLDRGHYDLLCSECRIASFLAIAKGDVDTEHWFHLGRQSTELNGQYSLLSWGGTMFEFMMPQLFQRTYQGSLIETSCHTAIDQQIRYGEQRGTPWGISESAFSAMAKNSDYQYKSFGVPGLGLKRGLSKDLVISPYSTALAVPLAPQKSVANLRKMQDFALGRWGYYDAVDYTPNRLGRKSTYNVVRNYMAHHQAMSLLAFANALNDDLVVRWFHEHPLVRANELLLQEKVPTFVDSETPNPDEVDFSDRVREEPTWVSRRIAGVHSSTPRLILMSNGTFSSMLTHTGGSYTQRGDLQVTRWRSDGTCDNWGTFLYLRDRETNETWSATYQPTQVEPDDYETLFSVDKAEIRRRQGDIETLLEVVVSPQHNAEVRQLLITNHGSTPRQIEVTSYAEVALASQAADVAHPAFQKLFVETEFVAEESTIIARRRPRSDDQSPLLAVHTMAIPGAFEESADYDTSRETFLGRNRTAEDPHAMHVDELAKSTGAVLDPVFAIRCVVTIPPSESVTIGVTTALADDHAQALQIADLYHDLRGVQRAFELAWAFTQVELRHLNLSARQVHTFQHLGAFLLYPNTALRANPGRIAANHLGQSALWRFGISGDRPILLVRISDVSEVDVLREIVSAHFFLTSRGLNTDLVICNDYPGSYFDSLQEQLQAMIDERRVGDAHPERVILLRGSQLTHDDHQLLDAVATVLLRASSGSLAQQIDIAFSKNRQESIGGITKTSSANPSTATTTEHNNGQFSNGIGQFSEQGQHYVMSLHPDRPTPAPWSNVIANPQFGCLLTESGGGYTWFGNSRENKLTRWSNDPVSDTPAEILYLRDLDSQEVWSPTVRLNDRLVRTVTHGQGFSKFAVSHEEIDAESIVSIHVSEPIKFIRVRLHNKSNRTRTIQATFYAETVLGVSREQTVLHQVSELDKVNSAIVMRNGYHPQFNDQQLFLSMLGGEKLSWTGDRRSFIGRDGSLRHPVGVVGRQQMETITGAGLDPCLVIQGTVTIPAGETEEVIFLMGATQNRANVSRLLQAHRDGARVSDSINTTIEQWNHTLSAVTVETPNSALNMMLNRWLIYQVLSCRVWGRSAFYQSGGAYGFRDQLQDVMALLYTRPDLAREQILRAASRQYLEGDVQHWWHPPDGKGTRTRFSDDFLFLPFTTLQYLKVTGDRSILDKKISFIESTTLRDDEQERYEEPAVSSQSASLLEHLRLTLKHGMRYGRHGLPLMGCGDWNDGMNMVGEGGEGESVWVAWFQIVIFEQFAELLRDLNDKSAAKELEQQVVKLRAAIEEHAWDGSWYRRAFFDDGTPLGSQQNDECQIDSLSQSWAVIADAPKERAETAFQSAVNRLVLENEAMVRLFDPSFDKTELNPGYIKGYVPGVRENGGQYSHAAMWLMQAAALRGDGELAMKLFDLLNPIHHSDTAEKAATYKVEPYVVAADVYFNPQHIGRGGWTWYTGAASWMYRVCLENILGIEITQDRLSVNPVVPSDWNEFQVTYRRGTTTWKIQVIRRTEDTNDLPSEVTLTEDGQPHEVKLGFD